MNEPNQEKSSVRPLSERIMIALSQKTSLKSYEMLNDLCKEHRIDPTEKNRLALLARRALEIESIQS